ncbi:hypothetical protein JIN77_12785 [Verrucomicrobiaceae bacterium R5-34]|nr:hypothetical protein [Verrucomicrobiaceae bacterium R5-34]
MKTATSILVALCAALATTEQSDAAPKKSLLNNDPDVIYLNEHINRTIHLLVIKPATIYATKKGGRKLGTFSPDTKVELIAITDRAYRVKGQATHAGVSGWISPQLVASKDKNFIVNLKKLYERQMAVKELIANHEVAIGMTLSEVRQSLGQPTETEVKQTREGESGQWDFVVTEEQKHYRTIRDPSTGGIYRQLSHITTEERSRTTIEFDNNTVTSVTRKKNNGPGRVRIIPAPVIFHW